MFKFKLRDVVFDTFTGYGGTITCRAEYATNQPNRYLVESVDSTGRPVEWWIDEERLELDNDD